MEPDELQQYIALKDQCTDIATEIYPHCKDLSPGGVKEMTALDPEHSEEAPKQCSRYVIVSSIISLSV